MNYDYIDCTAADIPVDLSDPAKCQIRGFLRQELTLENSRRSLLTFISKEARSNDPCIVVAPPSDLDPIAFLHTYGWISFAEKQHCFISVLVPENQKWNDQGLDADFLNCAYKKVQSREYFTAMQDCIYLFGFGDGSSIAQQAAMKMTSEWAGLATFGRFSSCVMQNAGQCQDTDAGQQDGELYIAAEKVSFQSGSSPLILVSRKRPLSNTGRMKIRISQSLFLMQRAVRSIFHPCIRKPVPSMKSRSRRHVFPMELQLHPWTFPFFHMYGNTLAKPEDIVPTAEKFCGITGIRKNAVQSVTQ